MNIRKRLLIFGSIWLFFCTTLLTIYFVNEARRALLQSAVKRSEVLTAKLAEQARASIYSGNLALVEDLLREMRRQPDVLDAQIEYTDSTSPADERKTGLFNQARPGFSSHPPSVMKFNGIQAIQTRALVTPDANMLGEADVSPFPDQSRPNLNAVVTVILSIEPIFTQINQLIVKSGIFLVLVLVIGVILGWALSGRMISPLHHLARRVSTLADQSGSDFLPDLHQEDELDIIQSSMDRMKRSLDRTAAELQRSQRMTAALEERNSTLAKIIAFKEGFIYQLGHELINPLSALSKHLSNFYRTAAERLTNEEKERYRRMQALSERLMRMISEEEPTKLLNAAAQRAGNIPVSRRQVDIKPVVTQVFFTLEWLQHKTGVNCLIGDSLKEGGEVYADPVHIEQILFNLVHNAIQVSPPGGAIVVEARTINSEFVEIRVKDSGLGIPHTLKSRLLRERVESTHQGSGRGLMICRFLVELHGGQIGYETDPTQGTVFYFRLPTHAQSVLGRAHDPL